jgi:hypothetical protein
MPRHVKITWTMVLWIYRLSSQEAAVRETRPSPYAASSLVPPLRGPLENSSAREAPIFRVGHHERT